MIDNNISSGDGQNDEANTYFEACLSEGDPSVILCVLGDMVRAYGMERIAKDTKLSQQHLYEMLSAKGNPSFSTVVSVIKALGLTLQAHSCGLQSEGARNTSGTGRENVLRR